MDKQQLKEREARVIELAVAFCNEYLDEECAELCTKMIQKLGRKRPIHYNPDGLRYGLQPQYIPSAA